jgi:hypothetical protein
MTGFEHSKYSLIPPASTAQALTPASTVTSNMNKQVSQIAAAEVGPCDVEKTRTEHHGTQVQPSASEDPTASSTRTTSAISTTTEPALTGQFAILEQARAKLAAAKKANAAVTPDPSQVDNVQVFEVTQLKTIKCDVCQQKNTNILYKCHSCVFRHQICSLCIESTESKPAGGIVARKDWSIHNPLKDAHAAYITPDCPGKNADGTYEGNGVKFVIAQRRKGGTSKGTKKESSGRRSTTPEDRNAALRRAIGTNKTLAQQDRVLEMTKARFERSQSQELLKKVMESREGSANCDDIGNKKRKAAALEDDSEGGPSEDEGEERACPSEEKEIGTSMPRE